MKLCKICASTTGKRSKATNKVFNLDACSDCYKFYKAADKTVLDNEVILALRSLLKNEIAYMKEVVEDHIERKVSKKELTKIFMQIT